jgi:cytochrome c-type biogenesis protein CcmH
MTGWMVVMLLAVLSVAAILLMLPDRRRHWPLVAAFAVLALAGYSFQGAPQLPASPAKPLTAEARAAEALLTMRADMDPAGGIAKQWLITADSYARTGRYQYSAAFIEAGLREYPRDGDLWAGLGLVLLLAGDNQMSPPAKMAFAKAREYSPLNRSPDYFEGLVELFEGRPGNTLKIWQEIIDGAPADAVWKPKLESQLQGLESMVQAASAAADNGDK